MWPRCSISNYIVLSWETLSRYDEPPSSAAASIWMWPLLKFWSFSGGHHEPSLSFFKIQRKVFFEMKLKPAPNHTEIREYHLVDRFLLLLSLLSPVFVYVYYESWSQEDNVNIYENIRKKSFVTVHKNNTTVINYTYHLLGKISYNKINVYKNIISLQTSCISL